MKIGELVEAIMAYDTLSARQWVADAGRSAFDWTRVARPAGLDATELAVAAGVVELLAARAGLQPPSWTRDIPASPEVLYLLRYAERMPRLRKLCEEESPEPLRKRGIFATPEFLTVA